MVKCIIILSEFFHVKVCIFIIEEWILFFLLELQGCEEINYLCFTTGDQKILMECGRS